MANPEVRTLEDLGPLKGDTTAASQTRVYEQKLDAKGRAYATGKRKDAVARVWVKQGPGKITVNGKDHVAYFARPVLQMILKQPLVTAKREGQYDIICTVSGGGLSGQAGAVRHGISKALTRYEPELRGVLEEGRVPDPRRPHGRAQEVRQGQGPKELPVLQALATAIRFIRSGRSPAHRRRERIPSLSQSFEFS